MKPGAILDTGPLVAFLNRRERYHPWAVEELDRIEPPLLTCEAVLSEACFLLRESPQALGAIFQMLERGLLRIPFRLEDQAAEVFRVMERYRSLPVSMADACLVLLAELEPHLPILTLDSDFLIVRTRKGRPLDVRKPGDPRRS